MNQSELRKGNYFNLINRSGKVHLPDSTVFEVVGLPYDFIQCKRRDEHLHEMSTGPYIMGYSDASPIPLTPEWLERAGFSVRESSTCKQYYIGHNEITHDWLFDLTWLDEPARIKAPNAPFYRNGGHTIYHIHQLQNLFFSLTGKELEFKDILK